jgi:hypothetical protein
LLILSSQPDLYRAQSYFEPQSPLFTEIPSALAFRSIVLTDVSNFAAISDAVAPLAAIAITWRSFFKVNRPGIRLPTIRLHLRLQPFSDACFRATAILLATDISV